MEDDMEPKKTKSERYVIQSPLLCPIRTEYGLERLLGVYFCSDDQNSNSWIDEPDLIEGQSSACRWHGEKHPIVSFQRALDLGYLQLDEGAVVVSLSTLMSTLMFRPPKRVAARRRKAS